MTRATRARRPWLWPLVVFLLLGSLTAAVWQQQVEHQRELLARHTADVCNQTSRRLQLFVDARIAIGWTFAKRWATHEARDYSFRRFEQISELLLAEVPDYQAVALLPADGASAWVAPESSADPRALLAADTGRPLALARERSHPVLSSALEVEPGQVGFYLVFPLLRDEEFLGHLVVELRGRTLFDELMQQPMQSEFGFVLEDSRRPVLEYVPDMDRAAFHQATVRSSRLFRVGDRDWRMTVVPRRAQLAEASWRASLAIPALGGLLSIGLTALSYLLLLRIRAYRWARDDALREVAERSKAEAALRASEARYRSVFDSTTVGLLVLEPDGLIIEANAAACAMHGYPEGGLDGRNVREIIAPDNLHLLDDFMHGLERAPTVNLESVDVRTDGSRLDVEVRGSRFMHEGRPALLAVIRDLTARKMAMEQLTKLSSKVLVAQEEERARLSRDLHDGLGQTLTALRFELDWLAKKSKNGAQAPSFLQATGLLETSARELRRICRGLRPPILDDLGLESAARQLVEEFEEHSKISAELAVAMDDDAPALSADSALCAYRVLQEALTNVSRHSGAKHVRVDIVADREELRILVEDDGEGFDAHDDRSPKHLGIAGMRERAKLAGGTLELRSESGKGTRVTLHMPVKLLPLGPGERQAGSPDGSLEPRRDPRDDASIHDVDGHVVLRSRGEP